MTGLRVVIIDDLRDHAAVLAFAFEALGHRVRVAFDGPSGLSLVLASAPHLVLVDIILPNTHGWTLARAIRSMPLTAQPRLVAISGQCGLDQRICSLAAGFDDHVVKPFGLDTLTRLTTRAPN